MRATAKADPLWGIAFTSTLLLPWMLIVSRAGMEVCTALIGLSFLWRSYRSKDWGWCREPFFRVCFFAWLWLLLVVSPLALNVGGSLSEAAPWIRFPLLLMALRHWVLVRREMLYVLACTIVFMLVLAIIDTLWQSFTGMSLTGHPTIAESGRLTGPLLKPKIGTLIAKLLLPAAAILFVFVQDKRSKIAIAGLVLLALVTILLSAERTPFVTTLMAGGLAMVLMVLRDARLWRVCALMVLICTVLSASLYMVNPLLQKRMQQTIGAVSNYTQSDYGQLVLVGLNIAKDHPLHGVGIKGFRILCPDIPWRGATFRGNHPHNAYIEWLSETGVVGLIFFIAILSLLAREAWRLYRTTPAAERLLPVMALGALVQHFFPLIGMQSYFTNWPATIAWLSLSLIFAAQPRPAR